MQHAERLYRETLESRGSGLVSAAAVDRVYSDARKRTERSRRDCSKEAQTRWHATKAASVGGRQLDLDLNQCTQCVCVVLCPDPEIAHGELKSTISQ